jgi:dihydrofolate reductase
MGRKTYESIGRPLPGRTNIVLSRQQQFAAPGVIIVHSSEQALAEAGRTGATELMVIGGEDVYRTMLPLARRLYLTRVDLQVEGDAFFPPLEPGQWLEVSRHDVAANGDTCAYSFVVLEMKN